MSKKIRLGRKIGFQNTLYTKCINVLIDSICPSIILRSMLKIKRNVIITCKSNARLLLIKIHVRFSNLVVHTQGIDSQ